MWMLFGRHTAEPHGVAAGVPLGDGDPAFLEVRGMRSGYCATLVRTALVGRDAEVERAYEIARSALETALEHLVPGATTGEVDAACRRVVVQAGLGDAFRHRTGYSIGLRANGRRNIGLRPGGDEEIIEGMTFHLPINLFEAGRFGVGCSETVVVTPRGARPLGAVPRDLRFVDPSSTCVCARHRPEGLQRGRRGR